MSETLQKIRSLPDPLTLDGVRTHVLPTVYDADPRDLFDVTLKTVDDLIHNDLSVLIQRVSRFPVADKEFWTLSFVERWDLEVRVFFERYQGTKIAATFVRYNTQGKEIERADKTLTLLSHTQPFDGAGGNLIVGSLLLQEI